MDKKEANRLRQQRFYKANKERLTQEKRDKYNSTKENTIEPTTPKATLLQQVLQAEVMKPTTLNTFTSQLKMLESIVPNLDTEIFNFDNTLLLLANSNYSLNSKKSLIAVLLKVLSIISPTTSLDRYIHEFNRYKILIQDEQTIKRATNILPSFVTVLTIIKDRFGVNSKEYLISSMYEEMCVRDDFHLKIVTDEKFVNDKDTNYLILTNPLTIQINSYKNDRNGAIIHQVSEHLQRLILNYIESSKPSTYLLGIPISHSGFIGRFLKQAGINTFNEGSVNFFRKLKRNQTDDLDERVRNARLMGHSVTTAEYYKRTIA